MGGSAEPGKDYGLTVADNRSYKQNVTPHQDSTFSIKNKHPCLQMGSFSIFMASLASLQVFCIFLPPKRIDWLTNRTAS